MNNKFGLITLSVICSPGKMEMIDKDNHLFSLG